MTERESASLASSVDPLSEEQIEYTHGIKRVQVLSSEGACLYDVCWAWDVPGVPPSSVADLFQTLRQFGREVEGGSM